MQALAETMQEQAIKGEPRNLEEQAISLVGTDMKEYLAAWKRGEEAYYPVNDERNQKLYSQYAKMAQAEKNVIFGGRLAEYKYYDMDDVIKSALASVKKELQIK